jgi:hypothetical protein
MRPRLTPADIAMRSLAPPMRMGRSAVPILADLTRGLGEIVQDNPFGVPR